MKIKTLFTTFRDSPHVSTSIHTCLLFSLSIPKKNKRKENILRYPLNKKKNTPQKLPFIPVAFMLSILISVHQ